MKNVQLLLFTSFILFAYSCKKIEPPIDPSQANDPIYLIKGMLNGDSLNLAVNDTTVFISNAPHNINGIEGFSSTISNVKTGFELKVIALKPELLISEAGIQAITNASTNFLVHQPICKSFKFSNGSNQENYTKISVNGESFNGNEIQLNEYGKYDVEFNFSNIGSQSFILPVKLGFKDETLNPYFNVNTTDNKIVLQSENTNASSTWLIDGNLISTNSTDSLIISNGIHTITHSVKDTYNNIASYSTLINYHGHLIWQMSPEYCSTNIVENNFSNIIIEALYQGEKYTSAYNPENLSKEINVTDIEYILDPVTQMPSFVKLNVTFEAQLKSINNSKTVNLTEMKGTFHFKIN